MNKRLIDDLNEKYNYYFDCKICSQKISYKKYKNHVKKVHGVEDNSMDSFIRSILLRIEFDYIRQRENELKFKKDRIKAREEWKKLSDRKKFLLSQSRKENLKNIEQVRLDDARIEWDNFDKRKSFEVNKEEGMKIISSLTGKDFLPKDAEVYKETLKCPCLGERENCSRCFGSGYYEGEVFQSKDNKVRTLSRDVNLKVANFSSDERGGDYGVRERGRFLSNPLHDDYGEES